MAKTRIVRELIITVGFLPGLWLYIGVNPEAQVIGSYQIEYTKLANPGQSISMDVVKVKFALCSS